MAGAPQYWFPAKRYGWGWGLPRVWQGRVVLGVFFGLVGVGIFFFGVPRAGVAFLAYNAALCAALIAVCWAKGEPPRWRWGGKSPDRN